MNPQLAEKDWPPAVVGGVFQTGLNLMRDLLRKGVRTVAVDHLLEHEGFRSVYGKSYECPNPDSQPAQWVEFMQDLSRRMGTKPVFIPAADAFVSALGRHAEELQDYYLFSPRGAKLQAALCTKETQYALATEYGFPCPRMAYIKSSAELRDFIEGARFPCLIKPLSQREWDALPEGNPLRGNKIKMADTPEELMGYYALAEPHRPEAIAQEIIQGTGEEKRYYMSTYASDGSLVGNCALRAVRGHPPFTGMPAMVKPIIDEDLTTLCDGFLRSLNYVGICEFEMKKDVRDGIARLIEINPRFSGTGDCSRYVGLETGWLHYLDLIGQRLEPVKPGRFDFHHVALKIECSETVPYLLDGTLSWREVFAPYRGRIVFYDLNFRDWRLAAATLGKSARYLAGCLLRHWKLR